MDGEGYRTTGSSPLRIEKISRHDVLRGAISRSRILGYQDIALRRVGGTGSEVDRGIIISRVVLILEKCTAGQPRLHLHRTHRIAALFPPHTPRTHHRAPH